MINPEEIEKFSKEAPQWWDESGPFAPLHRLNPARMQYLKTQICQHHNRDHNSFTPFTNLSILDVGCGGGLVCEPLARLGATVTGLDADTVAIDVAKEYAQQSNLEIEYLNQNVETITQKYDVVLALEIIEHVDKPEAFVKTSATLLKPGGLIIFSTLNRTAKSYALGIIAAEYILRWVPTGTHDWKKFIKPSELARFARAADLTLNDTTGLIFNPLKNDFALSNTDIDVNYFMSFVS